MGTPRIEELIEAKRDAHEHTREEIDALVLGFARGDVPDYQMSAWLMAAYLNGLSHDETVWLTDSMVRSGRRVDLSSIPGVKVDKHSTGGVADTTTLVLAPLVASCGVPIAKMSGRGLGHTGGTLDKLESIPGFRVSLTQEDFTAQVRDIGIAVIAQTSDIDPADKLMYALRDVTATVPSIPLIVGSIISKKIAGGADAIVLDVKVGSGAFMQTDALARELASELTRVGRALGRDVTCVLTDMDQPLGMAIGNSLEVAEAVQTLSGHGPAALTELCLLFGSKMLVAGQAAADETAARHMLRDAIESGRALDKFEEWVTAQGGDGRVARDLSILPIAGASACVRSPRTGFIAGFDTAEVGRAAMMTGAGRATLDDVIDPAAGMLMAVRVGDRVVEGDTLCTVFATRDELVAPAAERLISAVRFSDDPVDPPALVHEL